MKWIMIVCAAVVCRCVMIAERVVSRKWLWVMVVGSNAVAGTKGDRGTSRAVSSRRIDSICYKRIAVTVAVVVGILSGERVAKGS